LSARRVSIDAPVRRTAEHDADGGGERRIEQMRLGEAEVLLADHLCGGQVLVTWAAGTESAS
jgi:hypothetical protein